MPAKNSLKLYLESGYYHLYNRGVAKCTIFLDQQDYAVFISYLKEYLSPEDSTPQELNLLKKQRNKNYYQEIDLLAYCLMPNHFHLLVKQKHNHSIEGFMRSLLIRYSKYFNKRYDRVGHLFQDVYKGILIEHDNYLLWLSRYIHRNPIYLLQPGTNLASYSFSSYPAYLGYQNPPWLNCLEIKSLVPKYQNFVEDDTEPIGPISDLTLES